MTITVRLIPLSLSATMDEVLEMCDGNEGELRFIEPEQLAGVLTRPSAWPPHNFLLMLSMLQHIGERDGEICVPREMWKGA